MATAQTYLWIALGSALGGVVRFGLSSLLAQRVGEKFPFGTLLVNVTGSLLIGLLAGLSAKSETFHGTTGLRPFLMVGFCGGYTTFSAFSLQMVEMLRAGQAWQAAIYASASVLLCLGATVLGYVIIK